MSAQVFYFPIRLIWVFSSEDISDAFAVVAALCFQSD